MRWARRSTTPSDRSTWSTRRPGCSHPARRAGSLPLRSGGIRRTGRPAAPLTPRCTRTANADSLLPRKFAHPVRRTTEAGHKRTDSIVPVMVPVGQPPYATVAAMVFRPEVRTSELAHDTDRFGRPKDRDHDRRRADPDRSAECYRPMSPLQALGGRQAIPRRGPSQGAWTGRSRLSGHFGVRLPHHCGYRPLLTVHGHVGTSLEHGRPRSAGRPAPGLEAPRESAFARHHRRPPWPRKRDRRPWNRPSSPATDTAPSGTMLAVGVAVAPGSLG